jgi:hypothetical protein
VRIPISQNNSSITGIYNIVSKNTLGCSVEIYVYSIVNSGNIYVKCSFENLPGLQKNDAEAVLVRRGCKLLGFDHEKGEWLANY